MTLRILHEDDDLVIVSKPPGLTVHRDAFSKRDEQFVLQIVSAQVGSYVFPVHRLDRQTSGVLVFTRSREATREMQAILAAPETEKTYLVLARGETPLQFESDRPLSNDRGEPLEARSTFRRLTHLPEGRCSLLEVRIHTGRRHQIRRHLGHLAHHVVGDSTHGKGRDNRWFREKLGLPRMFVHAWRLRFRPPGAAAPMDIVDPLPDDLVSVLAKLGVDNGLRRRITAS